MDNYKERKRLFNQTIALYLKDCQNACGKEKRSEVCTKVFDYIVLNKDLFDNYPSGFREIVAEKLVEFENEPYFDSQKYKKLLFGDDKKTVLCTPNVIVLPKLDENIANITATIIPNKIQVIFDDTKSNKLTKLTKLTNIGSFPEEEILDRIIGFIIRHYPDTDRDKILFMLNENKTVDQVKNNTTYEKGLFLVKVGDSYELYEKVSEISKGYLYNSRYPTITINKLGKFSQVC